MSPTHAPDQDALVAGVLAELVGEEREAIDRWSELDPAERRRIERLDVEVLASLARALWPARPRLGARAALLAAAASEGRSPRRRVAPQVGSRGWLPLAATLAALALGAAGFLWPRLENQRETLLALQAEVEELRAQTTRLAARERDARQQLALVGSPGVAVCPLRQRAVSPLGGAPSGVLYVAADHQHWYLALHGLLPCPEGRVYQLWFVAPEGAVSAGTFRPEAGAAVELSSATMPVGTRAVRITLEASGGAPAPSGPEILFGDQPMQLL